MCATTPSKSWSWVSQRPKTRMSSFAAGRMYGVDHPGVRGPPFTKPPSGVQVSQLSSVCQLPAISTLPSGMVSAEERVRRTDIMPTEVKLCAAGL